MSFPPTGMAATCYFMIGMVRGDHRNARLQQRMMRGRVMSQGFTVLAMCASGIWAGYRANQGCNSIDIFHVS